MKQILIHHNDTGFFYYSEKDAVVGPFSTALLIVNFIKKFVGIETFVVFDGYQVLWDEDDNWFWTDGTKQRGPFLREQDAMDDAKSLCGKETRLEWRYPSEGLNEMPLCALDESHVDKVRVSA